MGTDKLGSLIELIRAAGRLKQIKRSGWVKKVGIPDAESVADHSYRMTLLGAYLGDMYHLNTLKVVRMCLIHDLAESKIGDMMPEEKVSDSGHRKLEDNLVRRLIATLPQPARKGFTSDWNELIKSKTAESKLVWQIDKLEMGFQMKDYLRDGHKKEALLKFDPTRMLSKDLRALLLSYK